MQYKYLEKILKSDDKDLFNKVFEKDGFSFTESIIIDQLDNYYGREVDEVVADAKKFGCIIHNNDIILPAGLQVKITNSTKNDPTLFYVERNGAEFPFGYIDDNEEINVTFTEFGQKLNTYVNITYTTITDAYDQLKSIEKIFGVKIISIDT